MYEFISNDQYEMVQKKNDLPILFLNILTSS